MMRKAHQQQLSETGMRIAHRNSELHQENARLRAEVERYQALEQAADRVLRETNWMTRNDRDYLVDKYAILAIKKALAALDAGERETTDSPPAARA